MRRALIIVAIFILLCELTSCAQKDTHAIEPTRVAESSAQVTTTESPTTATRTTTKNSRVSTSATTTTTVATTTEPNNFELTDEKVADKIYDYFSEKDYTTAQIAGIIGNADIECGLEPSRGVADGGFGLFQLMDCPQRSAMFEEMNQRGVGKYTTSEYWDYGASTFDSEEDMNTFLDIMLDYTMNPDDPTWYNELHSAETPEEAAEIFLVHYERAIAGYSPIEYYDDYAGICYQLTSHRREAARYWYDYLENL
jgi:hypothetical protein